MGMVGCEHTQHLAPARLSVTVTPSAKIIRGDQNVLNPFSEFAPVPPTRKSEKLRHTRGCHSEVADRCRPEGSSGRARSGSAEGVLHPWGGFGGTGSRSRSPALAGAEAAGPNEHAWAVRRSGRVAPLPPSRPLRPAAMLGSGAASGRCAAPSGGSPPADQLGAGGRRP